MSVLCTAVGTPLQGSKVQYRKSTTATTPRCTNLQKYSKGSYQWHAHAATRNDGHVRRATTRRFACSTCRMASAVGLRGDLRAALKLWGCRAIPWPKGASAPGFQGLAAASIWELDVSRAGNCAVELASAACLLCGGVHER